MVGGTPGPADTSKLTAEPLSALEKGAGLWLVTVPAGTRSFNWGATVPSVKPCDTIRFVAAACVAPITAGTVAEPTGGGTKAVGEMIPPQSIVMAPNSA